MSRPTPWWPLLLVAAVLVGRTARAAPPEPQRTVAVVRGAGPAELAERLRDEMTTLGWSVVELTPPRPPDGSPIDIRAVTEAISGSAGVLVRETEVVVWIQSPSGDTTALSETVSLAVDTDASLAAMQLVELLRARLIAAGFVLRTTPAEETPGPEPPAPPAETTPPAEAPPAKPEAEAEASTPPRREPGEDIELWLGAGAGLGLSTGGVPPTPNGWLRAWSRPRPWLGLGLDVSAALLARTVDEGAASADVRPTLALARFDYVAIAAEGQARVAIGVAAGLALVHVAGAAPPPDTSSSTWIPVAAFGARARYRHPLGSRLAITADALLGATAPRPVVRFYDGVAASWGRPFGSLAVGIEARAL